MGVKQSYENAKLRHELAAAQGLPEAKHNLAMLTYLGHINNRDTRISVDLFREAADAMGLRPRFICSACCIWKARAYLRVMTEPSKTL